jgi:hypothetical protein
MQWQEDTAGGNAIAGREEDDHSVRSRNMAILWHGNMRRADYGDSWEQMDYEYSDGHNIGGPAKMETKYL